MKYQSATASARQSCCYYLLRSLDIHVCVCLLLVRAKAKIKGNKYGATRSAGDYRRKVQLARLCALGGKDMVGEVKCVKEGGVEETKCVCLLLVRAEAKYE